MKKLLKRNISWIFFGIFLLVTIQFFVVLAKYEIIESQKVYYGVLLYCVPLYIILGVLLSKRVSYHLFYEYAKVDINTISKINQLKNTLVSTALVVIVFSFFTYNTVIQTNDWCGKDKYQDIQTEVLEVEYHNIKGRHSFGEGNRRWIITIEINGKLVDITTRNPYQKGEIFEITLNLGGAWGIIYAG